MTVRIAPINPFTPRQREVLELITQNHTKKEMGKALGIAPNTVAVYINGSEKPAEGDPLEYPYQPSRTQLGLLGIVEVLTHRRPTSRADLVDQLTGDVIFIDEEGTEE